MTSKRSDKGGRPPVYDESYHPDAAYELITESGADNAKLARKFRVSSQTIFRWLADHLEFRERVIEAQDLWNTGKLTIALMQRAEGIKFIETTREGIGDKLYITKKVTKFIAPDTGALKFALTNFSKRFAEKQEVKVETPDTLELIINTGKDIVKK